MNIQQRLFLLPLMVFINVTQAQPIPMLQAFNKSTLPINYPLNRIYNGASLKNFFTKLKDLKDNKKGIVRIVHIGDSHIQADFLSGLMRRNLQAFFGNAGRGLIFPYQLARSNTPTDISSKSNVAWKFNRVAHPKILINSGVSGYVIQTANLSANMDINLRAEENDSSLYFKRLQFFIDSNKTTSWALHAENNTVAYFINNDSAAIQDSIAIPAYHEVVLDNLAHQFSLTALPTNALKSFYGVSLQNDEAGVLYHSIGVNGSRYEQYNIASLFWQQLAGLQADLYIISLGTNEAQAVIFNESDFRQQLSQMVAHIKNINPAAAILITTAADYFKGKKANNVLKQLNTSLTYYCNENRLPLWDLYRVTNGYGSCYGWFSKKLMNKDKIHFTADGYRLQGQLLFNALAKEYNESMQP